MLFNHKITLAPLAGYTDSGHRALCVYYGAMQTTTEMVSVKALLYKNAKTLELLRVYPNEKLKAVQLFGNNAEDFQKVIELPVFDAFDIIDINMGCPMKKIMGNGEGCALMDNLSEASKIIKATAKSQKPVTVKFRKGVNNQKYNAVDFALMCQDSGASAITMHARFASDYYTGNASWEDFLKVQNAVTIPLYANGDIKTAEDIKYIYSHYKPFGVSIGRASLGQPHIFNLLSQAIISSCQEAIGNEQVLNGKSSNCQTEKEKEEDKSKSLDIQNYQNIYELKGNLIDKSKDSPYFDMTNNEWEELIRNNAEFSKFLMTKDRVFDPLRDVLFELSSMMYLPDRVAINEMRKHLAYYFKAKRGAKEALLKVNQTHELYKIFDAIRSVYTNDRENI